LNVEENAGTGASYHNDDYQNAGAKIVSRNAAYTSNIVLKVRQPNKEVRRDARRRQSIVYFDEHCLS
jgi:alanine dehydrogenase